MPSSSNTTQAKFSEIFAGWKRCRQNSYPVRDQKKAYQDLNDLGLIENEDYYMAADQVRFTKQVNLVLYQIRASGK